MNTYISVSSRHQVLNMSSATTETTPAPATTEAPAVPAPAAAKANKHVIAPARIKSHLSGFSINRVPKLRIKEIKKVLDPLDTARKQLEHGIAKTGENGAVVKNEKSEVEYRPLSDEEKAAANAVVASVGNEQALRDELAALQRCLYRFGNNSFQILEPIIARMLTELVEVGFDGMTAVKRNIIRSEHFHVADAAGVKKAESLMLFPLFGNLSNWRNVKSQFLKSSDDEEKTEVTEPELANDKSSFKSYIRELLKSMKKGKYANIRMSSPAKEYLDTLVVEFLRNFSHTILDILHSKRTKTVSAELVVDALHDHMKDGECFDERLVYAEVQFPDPAAVKANAELPEASRKPVDQLAKSKTLIVNRVRVLSARRAYIDALIAEVYTAPTKAEPEGQTITVLKEVVFPKPNAVVTVTKPEPKPDPAPEPAPAAKAEAKPRHAASGDAKAEAKAKKEAKPKAPKAKPEAKPAAAPVAEAKPEAKPEARPTASGDAKPAAAAEPVAAPAPAAPKQKRQARPKPAAGGDAKPEAKPTA